MHRSPMTTVSTAAIGFAVLAAPATAQAPRPTLAFDRPCYGQQDVIEFSGQQYTAGGEVGLLFAHAGRIGSFSVTADPSGAIGGRLEAPDPDRFLDESEDRATLRVTANDQTRMEDGTAQSDPQATFGISEFTLARTWARLTPASPKPGRRLRVQVRGAASESGTPMYLHYRRGTKSIKVVPLGRLSGPCGDLSKRVARAFPVNDARPGKYTLYVSTARRNPRRGGYFSFPVRVR